MSFGLEVRGHPKRNAFIWRSLDQTAIGTHLPTDPIQKNPFTIELFKGAKTKVAMIDEVFHLQGAPKDPFHNGGGSGELPQGVMVEIEVIRQRFTNHGASRLSALLAMTLQSLPMPSRQV